MLRKNNDAPKDLTLSINRDKLIFKFAEEHNFGYTMHDTNGSFLLFKCSNTLSKNL